MTDTKPDPKVDIALAETPFTYRSLQEVAKTDFVPKAIRGNLPAIYAAVMAGRELGLPPMEAMRSIDVIDGNPTLSGELCVRLIRGAGHKLRTTELSDERATVTGVRAEDPEDTMTVTFTIDMAKRANLTGKSNWKNYPESMLFWRAVTMLARMHFPDAIGATRLAYLPDEYGADITPPPVDTDGEDIDDAEVVETVVAEEPDGTEPFELVAEESA